MEELAELFPFSFLWPLAFLLLPLPFFINPKSSSGAPVNNAPKLPLFTTVKSLGIFAQAQTHSPLKLTRFLLILAWFFLVIAAARPTYYGAPVQLPLNGRDLMLAIDISPSMEEQDLTLNNQSATRLMVVKDVVTKFISQRQGDRVGLILFGSEPYVQAPLTFDTKTVETLLNEAYLGMAGNATAIGDAITLGVKRLRDRPADSRVLILMSDGANTAGEIPPEKAAQLAAKENIKIYTIGIGADEMLKRTLFFTQRVNPSADLDEKMLTDIAATTGGDYFRARDSESLASIYQEINTLEPIELESKTYRPSKALYFWFLALACLFYLAALVFQKTRLSQLLNGMSKRSSS